MTGHSLVPVGETDVGEMARIHALSFDDAWSGATFRRILATRGTCGIAARHDRKWTVSGFALLRLAADECELLTIAVAPERRGLPISHKFCLDADAGAARRRPPGSATRRPAP